MKRFGFIVFLFAICLSGHNALSDNSARIHTSVTLEPRRAVQRILAAEMTPDVRMAALEPYIDVGRSKNDIDKLLDWHSIDGFGPGFHDVHYGGFNLGLIISYYPDGEAYSITYRANNGTTVNLRRDDPITWPKTTDGKNAMLRQKTGMTTSSNGHR